jgi:hypothetical protein
MPEKNVNLSMHKMSWNFRNKLKFSQCFKQMDTYMKNESALSKTNKPKKFLKNIPRGLSGGMVDDESILL